MFAFAEAGATGVILADLNDTSAHETAKQSQIFASQSTYRSLVIHLDVTDPASVQAVVDTAMKEFGRIDYSVHCAGVTPPGKRNCGNDPKD